MAKEPLQALPKTVFLCYRRDDSEEVVDRIYETLAEQLSDAALFRDLDDIEAGADFPSVIRQRLRDCNVVLVFIGRDWLTIGAKGRPRLDDSSDPVRQEVQAALVHPHATVIPVLVRRAKMPNCEDLPPELGPLARLNSIAVRSAGQDYKLDIAALVDVVRRGVEESEARRMAGAEREEARRQRWTSLRADLILRPLDDTQWKHLLKAVASDNVVVICGSEFGTEPGRGDAVCREASIAAAVAAALCRPAPPLEAHRPLAQLAGLCYGAKLRNEFARALCAAADAPTSASALQALARIEPLRLFLTCALDKGLEAALKLRSGNSIASVAYAVGDPSALDKVGLETASAVVFHVAGLPRGLDGDAAVTDSDWLRFANGWRERRPEKLAEILEHRVLLFLGGGYPTGFVEFWVELARVLRCRSIWVGGSVFAQNPALASVLRDSDDLQVTMFDDSGEPGFLEELAQRWEGVRDAQPPPGGTGVSQPAVEGKTPTGVGVAPPASIAGGGRLSRREPWPGPRPYLEEDRPFMYGREVEVRQLVGALRQHPVTVLISKSGMGKTSLLLAGVVPAVRGEGVVPVVLRFDWIGSEPKPIRQQVLRAVMDAASLSGVALPPPEENDSLWSFFHRRDVAQPTEGGALSRFALFLDQFEAIFTVQETSPGYSEWREAGWRELADLVEGRVPDDVRRLFERDPRAIAKYDIRAPAPPVLISLREEFLPELTVLSSDMPSLYKSIIRVQGLSRAAAQHSVTRPGAGIFTKDAADVLIGSLESVLPQDGVTGRSPQQSTGVEPALLSLTCHQLNEMRLALGLEQVDASMMQQALPNVLDCIYEHAFAGIDLAIRRWVEDELVTRGGLRNSLSLEDVEETLRGYGLTPTAIAPLVDRRLLRVSVDQGVRRVELAGDWLLRFVLRSRDSRSRREIAGGPLSRVFGSLRRPK